MVSESYVYALPENHDEVDGMLYKGHCVNLSKSPIHHIKEWMFKANKIPGDGNFDDWLNNGQHAVEFVQRAPDSGPNSGYIEDILSYSTHFDDQTELNAFIKDDLVAIPPNYGGRYVSLTENVRQRLGRIINSEEMKDFVKYMEVGGHDIKYDIERVGYGLIPENAIAAYDPDTKTLKVCKNFSKVVERYFSFLKGEGYKASAEEVEGAMNYFLFHEIGHLFLHDGKYPTAVAEERDLEGHLAKFSEKYSVKNKEHKIKEFIAKQRIKDVGINYANISYSDLHALVLGLCKEAQNGDCDDTNIENYVMSALNGIDQEKSTYAASLVAKYIKETANEDDDTENSDNNKEAEKGSTKLAAAEKENSENLDDANKEAKNPEDKPAGEQAEDSAGDGEGSSQ